MKYFWEHLLHECCVDIRVPEPNRFLSGHIEFDFDTIVRKKGNDVEVGPIWTPKMFKNGEFDSPKSSGSEDYNPSASEESGGDD